MKAQTKTFAKLKTGTQDPSAGAQRSDGQAAINLYLREVGRVRPLKPQAQAGLAARMRKGDRRARELMIKSNLPLVVEIAKQYEDIGLPLLDLVGEGNLGLLKALERVDSTKAAMFPAYLSWWIRQSMKRALGKQPKASMAGHL
jgi:RNA polymerase primary sigma factor